jgi:Tellurite resistance protein TehB.
VPQHPADVEPSPTLKKYVDLIAGTAPGPILDAPCGRGRNALPFAVRGLDVYCVDLDEDALATVANLQTSRTISGRLIPMVADLAAGIPAALAAQRFGAIVNVHFLCPQLFGWWMDALLPGGFLYIETFDNRGGNYVELPRAGEYRALLSRDELLIQMYREAPAGPSTIDAVAVRLLAQKLK